MGIVAIGHTEFTRLVLSALQPPHDLPLVAQVLAAAAHTVACYVRSLDSPTTEVVALDTELSEFIGPKLAGVAVSRNALQRRLSRHPAYALLLDLHDNPAASAWIGRATGAALAESLLVTRRPVAPSLARHLATALRRAVTDAARAEPTTRRVVAALHRRTDALLSGSPSVSETALGLREALVAHYRRTLHFTGERRRQGVPDRATLSGAGFVAASKRLRQRVEAEDDTAMLLTLCAVTGLPPELARRLPLGDALPQESGAALDLARGLYLFDLDVVAPRAASAPRGIAAVIAATRELARPLPAFLVAALHSRLSDRAVALTIAELLPDAHADGRTLVTTDDEASAGFRPSLARYLTAIESEMLHADLDRLCAAHLSGRYQSVPHAALYYGLAQREALWAGATRYYEAVGWGTPMPFVPGQPVGARGIPTIEGLREWHAGIVAQVQALAPGRRYRLASLLAHHNAYARLVGSMAIFLLAGRHLNPIPLTADMLVGTSAWIPFLDKRVDARRARQPQPVCRTLARQLHLWSRHCAALAARLRRCSAMSDEVIQHLEAIVGGAPVTALVDITSDRSAVLQLRALGGSDLGSLWPAELRYETNFARGFWHSTLREHGLPGREIDAFMRHVVRGRQALSSTHDGSWIEFAGRVTAIQERVLAQCGIVAIQGLAQ